nr:putative ribonuclease H-like domain-containing protein [Tanacetum cinerariifolium]
MTFRPPTTAIAAIITPLPCSSYLAATSRCAIITTFNIITSPAVTTEHNTTTSHPIVTTQLPIEVILNGDSPAPTRVIDGVLQPVAPTTAEQSTTEPISVVANVSAVSAKIHDPALPNIDADDLEEMDLKWKMGMLTEECYNFHRKGHFATKCSYDWSFQADEEPTNYALMAFSSLSSSSDNELRDNALVVLRQNLEKAKQERGDLKLKLEKFQTSSKNLSELLASQTNDKKRSDESLPLSPIYAWYQSGKGYHAVPPPYIRTFMPPKPDLVFNNALNDVETAHPAFNVKLSPTNPANDLSHTHMPSTPIIEDWVSDSEDEYETKTPQNIPIVLTQSKRVPITAVRPVSTAVPKPSVTRPRQAITVVTKPNSPPRRHINHSPSPKASTFPPKVTVVKAPMVNAAKGDKGVIDSRCSRHMTGNMSYLSDLKELNGGYVSFYGNPKGGKISRKGSDPTWLFDIDTLTKTMNYRPFTAGNQSNPSNTDGDADFDEKEPEFEGREEGFDYEEVFALVARIEAISLFLAYASFMGFMVYQMNVKSAFLYGTIEEEVYVCQPPGFEDPDHPDKVYKVVKSLYGLHQAARAWYQTLANYLLENGFQIGKTDQTLFIKRQKGDILLVQIYVDDIIFGSTNKDLCKSFEKLMKDKFQMSSMGEITFFLGL